ncbi:thioredoxin-disulfide reductase [Roseixanthobacter liquoris]|uniref:thioredoxin-disulfide reductase n=1 Tax=Roseixanthobacter liquoris TaxID=3119921 RepID=UPI00372A6404
MAEPIHTRLLIIGAGPAGYTAAIYAARASLSPVLLTGMQPGGQLTITTDVENFPGFATAIQGPWLMEQMSEQARHVGARIVEDNVIALDLSSRPFRATCESGSVFLSDTLVIATGARARWLGLESERDFAGYGVSACATCDGFFFRNKSVAVIGGGNSAVEEALYLTNHASKVTLIHRRDRLKAEKILQDRLMANPKVRILWNCVPEEILGQVDPVRKVTGLRLRDLKADTAFIEPVDGVFVAIGHDPASTLVRDQLERDAAGYIRIGAWSTRTSIDGVFAAGDVADPKFRQAVTAAAMGCMAALEAEKFLAEHSPLATVRVEALQSQSMTAAWD